jgi:hypothetical protein
VVAGRFHLARAAPGYKTVDKFCGADGVVTACAETGLKRVAKRRSERKALIGFQDLLT